MLQKHYQLLSKMNTDIVCLMYIDWKEEVEDSVSGYSALSEEVLNAYSDKEIKKGEITKCIL